MGGRRRGPVSTATRSRNRKLVDGEEIHYPCTTSLGVPSPRRARREHRLCRLDQLPDQLFPRALTWVCADNGVVRKRLSHEGYLLRYQAIARSAEWEGRLPAFLISSYVPGDASALCSSL